MNTVHEKIIRKLVDIYDYVTAKELSEMTGLSVSTIKHNMKDVKSELEQHDLSLDSRQGKGFYLIGNSDQRQNLITVLDENAGQKAESFFYRRDYILETLLDHYPKYTIQMFAEELCVSKNMIQKDLEDIKTLLERYHLELIIRRNSGVMIEGNEYHIRQLMISNKNARFVRPEYQNPPHMVDCRISRHSYTMFCDSYPNADITGLQKQILGAEELLDVSFEAGSFYRLIEYLAVIEMRIRQGNLLVEEIQKELMPVDRKFLDSASLIIKTMFGEHESRWDLEVYYLAARMRVAQISDDHYAEPGDRYHEEAFSFAERMGELTGAHSLAWNDELIRQMGLCFDRAAFRDNYRMLTWDAVELNMQEQNPGLYAICMANLEDVEKKLAIKFTPDDIAWITLLINETLQEKSIKTETVLVTAADIYTADYQKHKIEKAVDRIKITETLHYSQFRKEDYIDKFIISSVRLPVYDDNYLEVTRHLRKADIQNITDRLQKGFVNPEQREIMKGISSILKEDLIVLDESVADKAEAIHRGSMLLTSHDYVEDTYEKIVWEREHFRPTYIGKGIAIPHAYKDSVKRNGIVLLRLKHPVEWMPKQKVRLVIMLAVNFETKQELREFFRDLYNFIEDDDRIDRIHSAHSPADVMNIFLNGV